MQTFAEAFHLLADAIAEDWRVPDIGMPRTEVWGDHDKAVETMIDPASNRKVPSLAHLGQIHPEWFPEPRLMGHWTM